MPTDYTKHYLDPPEFYVKDSKNKNVKITIHITDDIPDPQNWPNADIVFVLKPPPLDIPAVAQIWKDGRKLVLVREQGEASFKEFWHTKKLKDKLRQLKEDKDTSVFYMQSHQRKLSDWFPSPIWDRMLVQGDHFVYSIEDYIAHNDSFVFDDTYRRSGFQEYSLAQSANQYLCVLERLSHTTLIDREQKAALFRGVFPFYAGFQPVKLGLSTPEGSLAAVRKAVINDQYPDEYALAIASLSEIGACYNHIGRHDLYSELIGDLIRIDNKGDIRIRGFDKQQRDALRKEDPVLYLHLLYRTPNQFLIARFDGMKDLKQGVNALEKLEHNAFWESNLNFTKRTYEMVALNGTLCQFKTFAARLFGDRDYIEQAKAHGMKAIADARPEDLARDRNYQILAVLTDWARFDGFDPDEYHQLAEYLKEHLESKPDDYFNTMITFLAAAVEAEYGAGQNQIPALADTHQINPTHLQKLALQQQPFS